MKHFIFSSCFVLLVVIANGAQGATPPAAHKELSKNLENGIEWAVHLRAEAKKGTKLDSKHLDEEIKGTMDALSAMQTTAEKILRESPAEQGEGHFQEMQKYQSAANLAAKKFIQAKEEVKPNYSAMKTAAVEILKNLEDAKHWHNLELSEIEHNPKD